MIVLLVDQCREDANITASTLKIPWPDAEIIYCPTGKAGLRTADERSCDLIVIDLDMPDMTGFDYLEALYLFSSKPVIALKKNLSETEVVRSLQLGADECLCKPINQLSFIAKSQAVFRRYLGRDDVGTVVVGNLRLEAAVHRAYIEGIEIALTRNENIIMHRLMQNCGRVTSYGNIARAVWGYDTPGADSALRMSVQRLRKKILPLDGKVHIVTERAAGFRLVAVK